MLTTSLAIIDSSGHGSLARIGTSSDGAIVSIICRSADPLSPFPEDVGRLRPLARRELIEYGLEPVDA